MKPTLNWWKRKTVITLIVVIVLAGIGLIYHFSHTKQEGGTITKSGPESTQAPEPPQVNITPSPAIPSYQPGTTNRSANNSLTSTGPNVVWILVIAFSLALIKFGWTQIKAHKNASQA